MTRGEGAKRSWERRLWLAGATSLALAGTVLDQRELSVASDVLMFVTLAQSWNLIGGFAGYPSLGQVAFFGTGGYTSAVLAARAGLNFWLALPVGGVTAATLALVAGIVLGRLRGGGFAVATLGLAAGARELVSDLSLTGGAAGITVPTFGPGPHTPYPSQLVFYLAFLALAAVSVWLVAAVSDSPFGLALRAVRADELAASCAGVAPARAKLVAFVVSAALAGLAGGIYAFEQVVVFPDPFFSVNTTTLMVVMVVVGGPATVAGPVLGAVVFETLQASFRGFSSAVEPLFLPAAVILSVLVLPRGLLRRSVERAGSPQIFDALRRNRL